MPHYQFKSEDHTVIHYAIIMTRNKSEKVLIVGDPPVKHRFIPTSDFSNLTLPTVKDVIQRAIHKGKSLKTTSNLRKIAEELRATWIFCNVYPLALPTVVRKMQTLVVEFDR